ncbi:hypothetical protein E3P92_02529 [Wallemia ichthyophaga]|nr:hypothetical protein E3P92_02529 [Wallemia ichthyophaga]
MFTGAVTLISLVAVLADMVVGFNDLNWKKVDHKFDDALGDGWMGLEEIEGVDVDFHEGHSGERIVQLKVGVGGVYLPSLTISRHLQPTSLENVVDVPFVEDDEPAGALENTADDDEQPAKKKSRKEQIKSDKRQAAKKKRASAKQAKREEAEANQDKNKEPEEAEEPQYNAAVSKMPEWSPDNLNIAKGLPPALLHTLHSNSITTPTPIQKESLKSSLIRKDVIGVAETGSGKTLAYGLPILSRILEGEIPAEALAALILCPTRELALQVAGELRKFAPQKQQRQLVHANIVVATPGRLWEVLMDNGTLAKRAIRSQFLVIDEADRMIEAGHFEEMDKILRMTQRTSKSSTAPFQDEFESTEIGLPEEVPATDDMQTMVFSATLSKDLQQNLKRKRKAGSGKKQSTVKTSLDDLLMRLDFRDHEPTIIDLSPVNRVVSTLEEARIDCLSTDKDLYLYYFLLRYPGKTLVFVSSIDAIRRLVPLFETLKQHVFPLHSGLQQRQRLRNFDRFKTLPQAVMIATDVAARGLDVPAVDHVVHYQVPRTADAYIHRSGRTARAQRSGLAVLLVSPEERRMANDLLRQLNRDTGLAQLQIHFNILDQLKGRINLAKKIDETTHKTSKAKYDAGWEKEAAEALGVELDSDHEETQYNSRGQKKKKAAHSHLDEREEGTLYKQKEELKRKLAQPLMSRGISSKYLTTNESSLAHELVHDEHHKNILGANTNKATNDVRKGGKKFTLFISFSLTMENDASLELEREPLEASNAGTSDETTWFEKEKERLSREIAGVRVASSASIILTYAQEFEQALNNSNMLGRRLEEVLGVGKEFKTIAALWGVFGNIVGTRPADGAEDGGRSVVQGVSGNGGNEFGGGDSGVGSGIPGTGSSNYYASASASAATSRAV